MYHSSADFQHSLSVWYYVLPLGLTLDRKERKSDEPIFLMAMAEEAFWKFFKCDTCLIKEYVVNVSRSE